MQSLRAPLVWIIVSLLAGTALLHVYWALGGQWGARSAVPELDGEPVLRPGPFSTLAVAALLLLAAALVLGRSGAGPRLFPSILNAWGSWAVAVAFVARAIGEFRYVGFFKRRKGTRFAVLDTRFYSPLALTFGVGAAIIAVMGR